MSQIVVKKTFQATHEISHLRFHKCYEILSFVYYIRGFTINLKIYLKHCSECQVNQTKRHKTYETFQSIEISSISFHIVTMNFILVFSKIKKNFNCVMFVTCKFFKKMTLIPKRIEWNIEKWTKTFLIKLNIMNWRFFKQIINDRDRKFFSDFWNTLFIKLKIRLIYSTTYHSQTDDLSKKTNQSTKIVLRYHFVTLNSSIMWSNVFFVIQKIFNNSIFATERISNECVYEFTFTKSTDLNFTTLKNKKLSTKWIRQKIIDVIIFFQMIAKYHYDKKHKTMHLSKNSWTLLRFHHDYNIFSTQDFEKKLSQQYVGPFKILQRIENLIYRLEIPNHWRVHSIFIIIQLKSVSDFKSNSYNRQKFHFSSIHVDEDTDTMKNFVIKKIIKIKQTARNKKYFIKWKKYEPKKNTWKNLPEMKNALNLIRKFEKTQFNHISDEMNRFRRRKKFIKHEITIFESTIVIIRKRERRREKWWKHHSFFLWKQIVTRLV